jgi:SPP1 gp7 family putative phage head morphogenesis protein
MLIDVASDREFQRYLDAQEQKLYLRMWPAITAFFRLTVAQNSHRAQQYFVERGQVALLAAYRRIYHDQYMAIVNNGREQKAVPTMNDFMREQLIWLAAKAGSRITGMSVFNVEMVGRIIMTMVQEGRPNAEIARAIQQQAPELAKGRAAAIARTETHNAALAAIFETARYRRIPVRNKQWWTVGDDKVRPAHAAVHGVTVPFNEPFNVGGYAMQRPGDESAPAELVINCRCSLLLNTGP